MTASKNQYSIEKTIYLFLSQNHVFIIITITFEALKFLLSFCAVIAFANLCYKNILSSLLCYFSSSELIDYHVKTFFSENSSAFSEEVSNRKKDTIKIISINRETETQLQQTAALRSSSSVLAFTGKRIFHFSKVCNINRGLEPMYSCCLMLNSCCLVFHSCCVVLCSCCLVLYLCCLVLCRVVLMLCRVVLVLCRVVSCCTRVVSCCTRVVLCCVALSRVVSCCYLCSFLD